MEKLTPEDITVDVLNKVAVDNAGLLGRYTTDEFKLLEVLDITGWKFAYTPKTTYSGFVRLRPTSGVSSALLDEGRAKRIMTDNPDIDIDPKHIQEFVKHAKRIRELFRPVVVNVIVNNHADLKEAFKVGPAGVLMARKIFVENNITMFAELADAMVRELPGLLDVLDGKYPKRNIPAKAPRKGSYLNRKR